MIGRSSSRVASAFVLTVGALVLVGCTPPEPVDDPTVVWELDGTSELESDPAVEAARAADLAYRLAFNTLDFARADFVAAYSSASVENLYNGFTTQYGNLQAEPRVYPGPAIWLPISVETMEDESISVVVCDASDPWLIEDDIAPSFDLTKGFLLEFTLETVDGRLVVTDSQRSLEVCDATGAPVGRFDPVPAPRESISETDVIAPPTD